MRELLRAESLAERIRCAPTKLTRLRTVLVGGWPSSGFGFGFDSAHRLRHHRINDAAYLMVGLLDALGIEMLRTLRTTSSSPGSAKSALITSRA